MGEEFDLTSESNPAHEFNELADNRTLRLVSIKVLRTKAIYSCLTGFMEIRAVGTIYFTHNPCRLFLRVAQGMKVLWMPGDDFAATEMLISVGASFVTLTLM